MRPHLGSAAWCSKQAHWTPSLVLGYPCTTIPDFPCTSNREWLRSDSQSFFYACVTKQSLLRLWIRSHGAFNCKSASGLGALGYTLRNPRAKFKKMTFQCGWVWVIGCSAVWMLRGLSNLGNLDRDRVQCKHMLWLPEGVTFSPVLKFLSWMCTAFSQEFQSYKHIILYMSMKLLYREIP